MVLEEAALFGIGRHAGSLRENATHAFKIDDLNDDLQASCGAVLPLASELDGHGDLAPQQ